MESKAGTPNKSWNAGINRPNIINYEIENGALAIDVYICRKSSLILGIHQPYGFYKTLNSISKIGTENIILGHFCKEWASVVASLKMMHHCYYRVCVVCCT